MSGNWDEVSCHFSKFLCVTVRLLVLSEVYCRSGIVM